MRRPLDLLSLPLTLAVVGCASSQPAVNSGGLLRWSGNLQSVQQRTGSLSPTSQTRAYGSVDLLITERDPNRTRAQIVVNLPTPQSTQLTWGLLPGRCGSGGLPVMPVDQFPVIDVGNNGRGQLDVEMPMTLPTGGTYHVNVYRRGNQLNDVVTCANLKRSGGR